MVVITLGLIKFQKAIAGNSYRKTPRAWLGLLVVDVKFGPSTGCFRACFVPVLCKNEPGIAVAPSVSAWVQFCALGSCHFAPVWIACSSAKAIASSPAALGWNGAGLRRP